MASCAVLLDHSCAVRGIGILDFHSFDGHRYVSV